MEIPANCKVWRGINFIVMEQIGEPTSLIVIDKRYIRYNRSSIANEKVV
jgi:hypothetical protein